MDAMVSFLKNHMRVRRNAGLGSEAALFIWWGWYPVFAQINWLSNWLSCYWEALEPSK